jgi:very-short-patch-repair endonuclease
VRQAPVGPYFGDFLCRERRLIIEVDGATHSTDDELARDTRRTAYLEAAGYRVLRFKNAEIFENIDGVCETILLAIPRDDPAPG